MNHSFRVVAGLLFFGFAVMCFGLGLTMLYEAYAVATERVATISGITAEALVAHPHWWVTIVFVLGVVIGALVTHFSHWTP